LLLLVGSKKRKVCIRRRLPNAAHCSEHRSTPNKYTFPGDGDVWMMVAGKVHHLFASPAIRDAEVLPRFRATVETAKHSTLQWVARLDQYQEAYDLKQAADDDSDYLLIEEEEE